MIEEHADPLQQRATPEDVEATPSPDSGDGGHTEGIEPAPDLLAQLEQMKAQYARAMADYQNLERRSREERAEIGRIALAGVVIGLLPVLDDLERALEAAKQNPGDASLREGVQLVAQKFRQALEQQGVTEIEADGKPFDPTCHESVGASPGPEGQVTMVLRRGYALRDRVVRPAMVMVGNGEGDTAS